MAYARRKAFRTMRGGFISPTSAANFANFGRGLINKGITSGVPIIANKAKSTPRFKKYINAFESVTGRPIDTMLMSYLSKFRTQSGFVLPKIGVITTPGQRSRYAKVNNRGTGITRSKYTSGTAKPVPKDLYNVAYKQTYIVSDADSNFTVPNTGTTTSTNRGIAQYGYLYAGAISTLVSNFPSSVTAKSTLGSFYFSNAKSILTVTSGTNINCSLRVYECVAKRDTNVSTYNNPVSAWSNGIDQTTGSATTSTYALLGVYPSSSPVFREYWHVENYFDIDLAAGGTHIHTSTANINTVYANCLYDNHAATSAMSGLTRYYLFVLSGTPVHDQTNENSVALGGAKVDINIVQTFEYYSMPFTDEGLTTSVAADTIGTAEVVADSDFIETGVVN